MRSLIMHPIQKMYKFLLHEYGPQGWWPLLDHCGTNPTKTGSVNGYHPGDYSFPKTKLQQFEICIGAILTQNTSWVQVEKALQSLASLQALSPDDISHLSLQQLKQAIRPAGYFNQKARKLKEFTSFYTSLNNAVPTREHLLGVWGIGEETADSMLLYAFRVPSFVVDAYTRRIFTHLYLAPDNASYQEIKAVVEQQLEPSLEAYQEFHALLVEHAKRYYSKKPYGAECPLRKLIQCKPHQQLRRNI